MAMFNSFLYVYQRVTGKKLGIGAELIEFKLDLSSKKWS
jgi:hypothetical protein